MKFPLRWGSVNLILTHMFVAMVVVTTFYGLPGLRYSSIVEPTINDIDPVEFFNDYKRNPDKYVFLDVRNQEAYNKLHAKGSKLQPLHTLYTERLNLPKNDSDKQIVLICSGGLASGVGYSYLEHYGFRNIARIEGGIEKWQAEGLDVEGVNVIN